MGEQRPAGVILRTLSSQDLQTTLPSSRASCPQLLRYLHMECLSDLLVHVVGERSQESFCRCLIHSLKDKRQKEQLRLEQGVRKRARRGQTWEPFPTSLSSSGSLAQLRLWVRELSARAPGSSAMKQRRSPQRHRIPTCPQWPPQGMRCSAAASPRHRSESSRREKPVSGTAFPWGRAPPRSTRQRLTETANSLGALLTSPEGETASEICQMVKAVGQICSGSRTTTWPRDPWKAQQLPGAIRG